MAEGFLGEIRIFAGNYAPENWLFCNGQLLSIQQYNALYSLIGITFGGDDQTTFGLPDCRGMLVVGMGQGNPTNYSLAMTGGAYQVTVTASSMPAHAHSFQASNLPATTTSPVNGMYAQSSPGFPGYVPTGAAGFIQRNLEITMLSSEGANYPHQNIMPSLTFSYIICVEGLYPQFPN